MHEENAGQIERISGSLERLSQAFMATSSRRAFLSGIHWRTGSKSNGDVCEAINDERCNVLLTGSALIFNQAKL
jgi:hypothetical protein